MQILPKSLLRPLTIALTLALLTTLITACATKTTTDTTTTQAAKEDKLSPQSLAGQFKGILPCTDCSGWHTQLDLTADGQFTLTEQSLDEHEAKFVQTTGTWTVENKDDPIPFIALRAQDTKDKEPRYYEIVSPDHLIFVGLDKQQIETQLDYNLNRVDTP